MYCIMLRYDTVLTIECDLLRLRLQYTVDIQAELERGRLRCEEVHCSL